MPNLRKLTLLFLCACISTLVFAQNKNNPGIIIGNIVNSKAEAVSGASVTLKKISDSIYTRNFITDKTGAFEFYDLPLGYFTLQIKNVGYGTLNIDSIYLREERYDFNLGDIKLKDTAADLEEVVVYAEKPLIENKDGKLTYNVGESALSNGASTGELLKQMPLINNDPDGKILMKGKEPKILIDDKPVDLSAQQLADLLESLPGSSIEKIELMTNPPPQYATEQGGVINIVTKKSKIGWLGRVTASAGTRGEASVGGNVSYREKKLSLNMNANIGYSRLTGENYSRRENFYTDSSNFYNTDGRFKNKNLRPNFRIQTDYEISKKSSIHAVYNGNMNFFDNDNTTEYRNLNQFKNTSRYSTRNTGTEGTGFNNNINISFTHKLDSGRGTLRFIASGSINNNDNDRDFYQQYLLVNYLPSSNDSTQEQITNNKGSQYTFRTDYNRNIVKKLFDISAGASFIGNQNDVTLNTGFLNKSTNAIEYEEDLSNDFNYAQNIFNSRVALITTLPKRWRITTGIAFEYTSIAFEFNKGNADDVKNHYNNWLPNLSIRKEFNDEWNAALVYRSTIRRPGINELNPNINFTDPYNIRFGNPFLSPQLSDNYDFTVSYIKGKYYINTSIGYNKVKNIYSAIRQLSVNGNNTETTWQNIAGRNEYEASVWGGYTLSKKVRLTASAGYSRNTYDEALKTLFKYRDGNTFYTSLNYNFTLSNVFSFDGNARYNSFADPQGRSRSNLNLNMGVQRKFFNRRLTVSLNAINPLSRQRYTTFTYGPNYTLENTNATNTRNFRLSASYQLNKVVKKKPSIKLPPKK